MKNEFSNFSNLFSMNKYILDFIKNNTKTVFCSMSLPQKKAMKTLVKRIFQSGEGVLRKLGEGYEAMPKTMAEKFSRHLENVNLLPEVESYADRRLVQLLNAGDVIAYDLTDINKSSAKKMEGVSGCFDGSRREKSQGYFVHGVGCGRFLVRLRMHDQERKFLPQVRKEILDRLIEGTKKKNPIFAFDRGNDDKKLFAYLEEKQARFIIRLKKNRKVVLKNTGELKRVDELPSGRYIVLIAASGTEQHKVPLYREYLLVIHQKRTSQKTPLRLLCSASLDLDTNFSDKKIMQLYLQRWGVENSFKQIKQMLNLESIRVMTLKRFQNLVSLQHLCLMLNHILFSAVSHISSIFAQLSLTKLFYEYKKFRKRYTLTVNPHSFFRFLQKIFPTFYQHRKIPPRQLQTTLSLFSLQKLKTF